MKKKGFALAITILTMAIILGIFFNYTRATRSKKKMMQSSLSNQAAEKSVQETNGIAMYEMYLADQMITANNLKIVQDGPPATILSNPLVGQATGIQNILGYFTVRDTTSNNSVVLQKDAVKIWNLDNGLPTGIWYHGMWSGVSPNFTFTTYKYPTDSIEVPLTKGGYIITSITDITNKNTPNKLFSVNLDQYKIPILDTSGNRIQYPASTGSPIGKVKYKPAGGSKGVYEITLFKNITLFKKKVMDDSSGFSNTYPFKDVIRSYNAYVTLEIYWSNKQSDQDNDLNTRNNCSAAPNPTLQGNNDYEPKVGTDCELDLVNGTKNPGYGNTFVSKVTSYVLEDITPVIE